MRARIDAVVCLKAVGIVDQKPVSQGAVVLEREAVKQRDSRRARRLRTSVGGSGRGPLARGAYSHLTGSAEELDLLALNELHLVTSLCVENLLHSCDRNSHGEPVVVDAGHDAFAEHHSAKLLYAGANRLGCCLTSLRVRTKPQFDLAVDVLHVLLNAGRPVGEDAGFFEAVFNAPRANVAQEREDIAPLGGAMVELRPALEPLPQRLELTEGVLVRKDHVDASGVSDVCALLVEEEVLIGRNVQLVVFREELKPADLADGLHKLLDRPCGLEHQHVFRDDAGGCRL